MRRRFLTGALTLLMLLALTACGGKGAENGTMSAFAEAPMEPMESAADTAYYGGGVEYEEASSTASQASQGQKMIYTASLELETTAFDETVSALAGLTEELGGYYENSSVRTGGSGYRWANYTVRVPAENYKVFLNQAGELCHELWRDTSQEDISEVYYDTQGRLKTQQIKLERLQELLSRAEAMEDIITIESAISETEQQIDNLSGTLQHYDALVDYATVSISLQEVYKLSNVEEAPDSFASRMGQAFFNGLSNFGNSMEDLAVAFAYSWMWWLLLAAAVVVVVRLVRQKRFRLPRRGKKPDDKEPKS